MKNILYVFVIALFLSGCASPAKVDFTGKDPACSQQCTSNHSECMSGFKAFPIAAETSCNNSLELCVQACPSKPETPTKAASTTEERLKELESIYSKGLISKTEYETKRQSILDKM